MTSWQIAMLCIAPLCFGDASRFRTWGAMFASGLLGYLVSSYYAAPVLAFVAIDIVAARLILARPKGTSQQYIGLIYVGMICCHIGYILASNPYAITVYYQAMTAAGWLSWAILTCWGAGDAGKRVCRRLGILGATRDYPSPIVEK